jgi:hypothetical protein
MEHLRKLESEVKRFRLDATRCIFRPMRPVFSLGSQGSFPTERTVPSLDVVSDDPLESGVDGISVFRLGRLCVAPPATTGPGWRQSAFFSHERIKKRWHETKSHVLCRFRYIAGLTMSWLPGLSNDRPHRCTGTKSRSGS